jgi:hypothetical protein
MGLETATLAAIGLGVSGTATVYGISQNMQQRKAQEAAKNEQAAINKQQQLQEQRNQIRRERVQRARIMQSAENTGVAGSSGEAGAIGGLSTQLGTNLGISSDLVFHGGNITAASQRAANAAGNAQIGSAIANMAPVGVRLADSIFATQNEGLQGPLINQQFPNKLG